MYKFSNIRKEYVTKFFMYRIIMYLLLDSVNLMVAKESMCFRGLFLNVQSSYEDIRDYFPPCSSGIYIVFYPVVFWMYILSSARFTFCFFVMQSQTSFEALYCIWWLWRHLLDLGAPSFFFLTYCSDTEYKAYFDVS